MSCVDDFRAGVTACLRSWSALRTAVESGWGGGTKDSHQKAEDLRANILQHFDFRSCPCKTLSLEDLEDNLAIYMEEEFSVFLEDSSEQQLACAIWRMYEDCYRGDATFAQQMIGMAENAINVSAAYPTQLKSSEHDDDDDDDDDDDEDMMDDDEEEHDSNSNNDANRLVHSSSQARPPSMSSHEYASQSLFGDPGVEKKPIHVEPVVRQLGEAVPTEEPQVEVDDDGFAPVHAKSRRNGRKPV